MAGAAPHGLRHGHAESAPSSGAGDIAGGGQSQDTHWPLSAVPLHCARHRHLLNPAHTWQRIAASLAESAATPSPAEAQTNSENPFRGKPLPLLGIPPSLLVFTMIGSLYIIQSEAGCVVGLSPGAVHLTLESAPRPVPVRAGNAT